MITFNGKKEYIRGQTSSIRKTINSIIKEHQFKINQIDYIFVDDETLLDINRTSLNHNFYTDIITFDYTEDRRIEAEIYISIDRVTENANKYKTAFHVELLRVIFHGVLHCVGYKDKTKSESKKMRLAEEKYLERYKNVFHVELE